jgi:Uncharacterized conserved protein
MCDSNRLRVGRADGVAQLWAPGYRWVSTGHPGGSGIADAVYNITVPEGFSETDLRAYIDTRRNDAGFDTEGFALLTGVEMRHARVAQSEETTVIATAGVSNPALLPPPGTAVPVSTARRPDGTVNLLVAVDVPLTDAALYNLIAVVAEAKAATLLRLTEAPGTSSDAVIVGAVSGASTVRFSGSVTPVGAAVRACVRDAIAASLHARYGDVPVPTSRDAAHGSSTSTRPVVTPLRLIHSADGDRT